MKKTRILTIVLVVCLMCSMFAGCSIGKPTVDLNDYVTITEKGYDGYGSIYAGVDFDAIVSDYEKHLTEKSLDTQYFGNQTAEIAAEFVFSAYEPFALAYNAGDNVKNGDKIEFTWNTNKSAIQQLSEVLEVKFKYSNFEYRVESLKPVKEVDVFDFVEADAWGLSGEGSVYSSSRVQIKLEDDNSLNLSVSVDTSKNGTLFNGDTVHMTINDDHTAEYYVRNFGVTFVRDEADVIIDNLSYYAHENPAEIIEYLGDESVDNALLAATDYVEVDNEKRTVEYVGALYYYQNIGNEFSKGYNTHNQLLLIFHVENGKVPGGWYTYLAPNNDVVIGMKEAEDGSVVKTTMVDVEKPLERNYYYYQKEYYTYFAKYNHPIKFEYDGKTYVGHLTIEDCIRAYERNELETGGRCYDHVIATDNLMRYISVG